MKGKCTIRGYRSFYDHHTRDVRLSFDVHELSMGFMVPKGSLLFRAQIHRVALKIRDTGGICRLIEVFEG